jgi:hypothetical protein
MIWRKENVAWEFPFLFHSQPGYSVYLSSRSMRLYHPDYCTTPQGFLLDTGDSVLLESGSLRHYWRDGADPAKRELK